MLWCTIWILLIFVQHFIECVIKLGRHSVDLHLLPDNLILQVINPEMELADVHLSVLRASLGLLQSDLNLLDLLLVLLLPLPRLLLGHLQLLLVVSNSLELVLNDYDPCLGVVNPLSSSFELILHHSQRSGQVVILHFIVSANSLRLSEVLV